MKKKLLLVLSFCLVVSMAHAKPKKSVRGDKGDKKEVRRNKSGKKDDGRKNDRSEKNG